MRFLFSLIFLLFFTCSFAQTPNYWIQSAGSLQQDDAMDVAVDAANNVYTTGYYGGQIAFGNITLNAHGVRDIFLSKTDPLGNFVWAIDAGGANDDEALSVATDATGNVYTAGFFSGTASFSGSLVTSSGFHDMFVAKYNSGGILQWVRTGGGTQNDLGNSVAVDANGNVAVTGQFEGSAQFGGFNLVSQNDPNTGNPSIDIFTVYYNSSGAIQWAKKGSAEFTDRGIDLAFDPSGNLYVTGQFSDTITFDQVHNNNMYNAIFLVKYNHNGTEQWFRKIGGGVQNISYGIAVDNQGQIFLTGDFKGTLIFFNPTQTTLTNVFPNKIFLAKYEPSGSLVWATAEGSDGEISARNIALDDSSNAYLVGNYTCKFSAFANVYGQGCFNSVGFHDVFATKFDSTGNWKWARNYGGQDDDEGNGITVNHFHQAVITGSYQNRIVIPVTNQFHVPATFLGGVYSTHNSSCPDSSSSNGQFFSVGSSDLFILNSFHPYILPYYYYEGNDPACQRPKADVQISLNSYDNSAGNRFDTTCGPTTLYANTFTSAIYQESIRGYASPGPMFNYLWSTGATTQYISATATGTYTVRITSIDGCFTSTDTLSLVVYPLPALPKITDSKGVNINTSSTQTIYLCRPDSVNFLINNPGTDSIQWDVNGYFSSGNTYMVSTNSPHFLGQSYISGSVTKTDSHGCSSTTYFRIQVDTSLHGIIPKLKLQGGNNDSIRFCLGNDFIMFIYDSLTDPLGINQCRINYATSTWTISPNISHSAWCSTAQEFTPLISGIYQITCTLSLASLCGGTSNYILSKRITVIVDPIPAVTATISGNLQLCPGDSTTLTASGGPYYSWTSYPNLIIHGNLSGQTIVANGAGRVNLLVTDTNIYHCAASAYAFVDLVLPRSPTIKILPANGLICPNDSVKIFGNMTGTYHWQGPLGPVTSTSWFIYEQTPGFYFCTVDSGNCHLSSNSLELKQYGTPFLAVTPSPILCPDSNVEILVMTNANSIIHWNAPLSGNALIQTVSTPGTYTCSITSCGILTTASATVIGSNVSAVITASGPVTLCGGDSVTLSANPGMTAYQWSPTISFGQSIVVHQSGNYTVTSTDGYGCTTVSAVLPVNFVPGISSPSAYSNSPICSGSTLSLSAIFTPGLSYSWSGPSSFISTSSLNSISPAYTTSGGNYVLTAASSAGCRASTSITVVIDSLEPFHIAETGESCPGSEITLQVGLDRQATYAWSGPGSFTSSTNELSISTFSDQDTGFYSVHIVKGSCVADDGLRLEEGACDFVIPNVFTPNGDGLNDFFEIKISDLESMDCKIFNRWGKVVASWNSVKGKWDGTDVKSGTKLSDGVYYYLITLAQNGKKPENYHGYVELIRDSK